MSNDEKIGKFDFSGLSNDPAFSPSKAGQKSADKTKIAEQANLASAQSGFATSNRNTEIKSANVAPIDGRVLRRTDRTELISLKVTPQVKARLDDNMFNLRAKSRGHALEILLEYWLSKNPNPNPPS